jgi:hypothetical protein
MKIQRKIVLLFILVPAILASNANAYYYGFEQITDNGNTPVASQLLVNVTAEDTNQVLFSFFNQGPVDSSITDVYFDDGSLLGISSLIDSDDGVGGDPGVDFSLDASPGDLPGGNPIGFEVTAGFLADSDPAIPQNGINPDEWLGILFDLQSVASFDDVISQLGDGRLRIGLHVQSIGTNDGSESFVNNMTAIPIPSAVWLLGAGMVGLVGIRRKFKN